MTRQQELYVKRERRNTLKIRIIQVMIFVIFLSVWELTAQLGILNTFIFSSPSRIIKSFLSLAVDGSIFYHLGITVFETLFSFSLVILIGLLLAILLWWNKNISRILEPYLVILNSLPKSALAPLFIVWLGNNMKTIIVAAVSVAVFGAVLTLYNGFISMEEDKIKLIKTLGGTKKDILFKVVLPGNIPTLVSVMKVNIGLSLVGVIIGEFLAANAGLGYLIIYGSQVFKLDWVMMSIFILCILSALLYKGISVLEKRYHK